MIKECEQILKSECSWLDLSFGINLISVNLRVHHGYKNNLNIDIIKNIQVIMFVYLCLDLVSNIISLSYIAFSVNFMEKLSRF